MSARRHNAVRAGIRLPYGRRADNLRGGWAPGIALTLATVECMNDRQPTLEELRSRIEAIDRQLVELIGRRREVALEIGRAKQTLGLPVLDPQQEAKVVRRAAEIAREIGVDEELTRDVIWRIIAAARDAQEGRTRWGPPASAPTDK